MKLLLAVLAMSIAATAHAQVRVDYLNGVPRVRLEGAYAGSQYSVYRADRAAASYELIYRLEGLCTGECYADDYGAQPGRTYWYRFDVIAPDGQFIVYGPYPVEIGAEFARPVAVSLHPNPVRSRGVVELRLGGRPDAPPLESAAALYDLQGRAVVTFHRGPLRRGVTRLEWDGRDRDGHALRAGVYFLRLTSPQGTAIQRIVRAQ